jgi:hypothetical protein
MGSGKVGVGLKVELTSYGYVVSELVHKGPAKASGQVRVGDLIYSVDGFALNGNAAALPPMMIGLPGTEVVIGFQRRPNGPVHEVRLKRQGHVNDTASHQRSMQQGSFAPDVDVVEKSHLSPPKSPESPHSSYAREGAQSTRPASSRSDASRPSSRPHTSQGLQSGRHDGDLDMTLRADSAMSAEAVHSSISLSYSLHTGTSK